MIICIITVISCSKQNDQLNSNCASYSVVDSIKVKFKDITKIHSLQRVENNFICINFLDRINIILFDENGNILSSYNKKGKGPKELLQTQNLTVYENKVYVLDSGNNKLLILDLVNNQLKYNCEFKIDSQPMDIMVINEDKILIAHLGEKNILLYYGKGKILKSF